jgi:hypothetical protein
MNRPLVKYLLSVVLGCGLAALPASPALAQGFGSVSSAAPSVPAPAAASAEVAAPSTPAMTATDPVTSMPAPVAQLASLGFTSISGSAPDVTTGMPTAADAHKSAGSNEAFEQADRVVVAKRERRLYLYRGHRVVAEYPVKLGLNPYGHKQQEGDFRTPEGKYQLTRRNRQSEFFLSIQVSYPNREDAAWAKEKGWSPGGLIMIHGQPNVPKRSPEFYATRDWTDGCIALSNADMVDVWLRTAPGIPIEIRP